MATFTTLPSKDSTRETTPRVREAGFGDGYHQRVGDGIHSSAAVWRLIFANRTDTEADTVDNFLIARNGVEAFDWTDPYGYAAKWICKSWSRQAHGGGIASINATFLEVFGE
jgi:phage-related protein